MSMSRAVQQEQRGPVVGCSRSGIKSPNVTAAGAQSARETHPYRTPYRTQPLLLLSASKGLNVAAGGTRLDAGRLDTADARR